MKPSFLTFQAVWRRRAKQSKMEDGKMVTGSTINLNTQEGTLNDLTARVHQLPCCVKHHGSAPVSHYFKPKPHEGFLLQEARFRGRLLQGTTLPLPHPYSGFVLGKRKSGDEEDGLACWHANATFRDVTYWNHDDIPCHSDNFFRAFHWLTLANALHKPVTAEDLASTSTAL
ncbi:hypothetical protein RIF29_20945 [Crotalaria pallida]|uniref:Uncharacterized protein n=1 Tax=Crotalaria pallida TaxID=3830 RepID=A0AAN9F4E5_CROPI